MPVVEEAGEEHGTADREVERCEVGLRQAGMPDEIAHCHHDDDEEVAPGILEGKDTDLVTSGRLFVDAVDVLTGQFGEFEVVDQPAKGQATEYCGQ